MHRLATECTLPLWYSLIGASIEGRNIASVRMGHPEATRSIVLISGLHAREWIAPAAILGAMKELLTVRIKSE
eukprot:2639489-Pyramimonas_sp.AAC.2